MVPSTAPRDDRPAADSHDAVDRPFASLRDRERLYWLLAILCYGVGDTVTTFWGLSTSAVVEIGPVAGPAMAAYGRPALLAIKVAVFALCYGVWSLLETPGRIAIPLALVVVGAAVTGWNVGVTLVGLYG